MIVKKIFILLMLLIPASPAFAGQWRFDRLDSALTHNKGAIVVYEPDHPDGIRLAFKCLSGEDLRLLLGVYLPVYMGMDRRHRVLIRVGRDGRYRFKVREVARSGIAADEFYTGLEAEVRKMWFMSRKAIAYRNFEGKSDTRVHDVLRALRDGYGEAEVHIGKKIATISLQGSAHAVNKFTHICNLDID